MKVYPIADTHGDLPDPRDLPEGAVVLHAGDLCHDFIGTKGTVIKLQKEWMDTDLRRFLSRLPPKASFITTGGNHDFAIAAGEHRTLNLPDTFTCLLDRSMWVPGVGLVMGTPWCHSPIGWAYHAHDEDFLRELYEYTFPVNPVDLWLTHQPPIGPAGRSPDGVQLGSEMTHQRAVKSKVRVVVTGHIHSGYGVYEPSQTRPYLLINAAVCDEANNRVRDWQEVEIGDPYGGSDR